MSKNKKEEKMKDHLSDSDDLLGYLKTKAERHRSYKTYTSLSRIEENIFKNHCLYLSDGSNWNDTYDSENFSSNKVDKYFGMCFSFSKSENVAMWMLYGGKGQSGGMINFTYSHLKHIMECKSQINLGYFEGDKFVVVQTLNNDQFEKNLVDILYYSDQGNTYDIKRSDDVIKNIRKGIVDQIKYVKKKFPWNYENECRMIYRINREKISNNKISTIQISIPKNIVKKLSNRVYNAPNSVEIKYNPSELNGQIKWNLCKDCAKREDFCVKKECNNRILR